MVGWKEEMLVEELAEKSVDAMDFQLVAWKEATMAAHWARMSAALTVGLLVENLVENLAGRLVACWVEPSADQKADR